MRNACVRIVRVGIVLLLCTSPVMATLTLGDGGVHNIDYAVNEDILVDFELPGLQTTVNMLDGGSIPRGNYPYHHLKGFEDSIINILGGSIDGLLYAYDSSQVTISGGSVHTLAAEGTSRVTVSGDSMDRLFAEENSQVTVSGGSIERLWARDTSQLAVSGGSIKLYFTAHGNSRATVSGGSIEPYLHASDKSQVTISGGLLGLGLIQA